jgi:hypothetical protein
VGEEERGRGEREKERERERGNRSGRGGYDRERERGEEPFVLKCSKTTTHAWSKRQYLSKQERRLLAMGDASYFYRQYTLPPKSVISRN